MPAQEIVKAARDGFDPIAMGTHGLTGFEHLVLGSVAERVLRTSPVPVLTVPPRAVSTSSLPFHRIVCPVDRSETAAAALTVAQSIARESGAELTVGHVVDIPAEPLTTRPIVSPEDWREFEAELRTRLGADVVIRHGKPYREILEEAVKRSADLIVIGVHGRNPIDMLLFGSTTNQVVRRATCPVLTIRA